MSTPKSANGSPMGSLAPELGKLRTQCSFYGGRTLIRRVLYSPSPNDVSSRSEFAAAAAVQSDVLTAVRAGARNLETRCGQPQPRRSEGVEQVPGGRL